MSLDEFALIERIARRTRARADIVLGIGDDAALLQPAPGQQLAVTADTLNAGVHFPAESAPADIGWKALAANLSDLAAMGAVPAWCTLSLSLPQAEGDWLDAFADGLFALADASGIAVVGGDTTRGPLSISITAMGQLPAAQALRRDGARVGDDIWVSGHPGEAAGALRLWQQGRLDVRGVVADAAHERLRQRLQRPMPRLALGLALRSCAHAAADVSDGLLADLGHIASRSGVAAVLQADAVPLSAALRTALGDAAALDCALRGGDDYELCFTAAPERRQAVQALAADLALPLARIGVIAEGRGVHCEGDAGAGRSGYRHFAE
ncbi:MAG: thiamine-phosphate kinase [Lysobacteraceae bacterium SCN 69-123]|uniref:thiamine-phosphate kinase n=1 Tax=Stenotrophomonas acidaminiphila TaxID=128780 RepID=UPI00086E6EB3|nr:thiamine-phosphate kinase [Stenotrophomonas acidaminiphila]MDF9443434.1 thiamine-phosphate kinase [Stenotrophomonas acidaminiphila]ODU44320.1 MAG: thiamine-phosphate kinase [Xanthomonadaceae bacterium SCN 69-123]OJY80630.1 MAG: thiamine-phosphate kinase [Stenotrophomonas sp. 69-14]